MGAGGLPVLAAESPPVRVYHVRAGAGIISGSSAGACCGVGVAAAPPVDVAGRLPLRLPRRPGLRLRYHGAGEGAGGRGSRNDDGGGGCFRAARPSRHWDCCVSPAGRGFRVRAALGGEALCLGEGVDGVGGCDVMDTVLSRGSYTYSWVFFSYLLFVMAGSGSWGCGIRYKEEEEEEER
jgi:hypothetical protein